jgi:stage III sporulation protein AE
VFSAVLALVFAGVGGVLPMLVSVVAIAVLSSLLGALRSDKTKGNAIVYHACFAAAVVAVCFTVFSVVFEVRNTVAAMQAQMNVVFPVLLGLITAIGGTASAAIYQPAVAVLAQFVGNFMSRFILPLFIFSFIFNILSGLSPDVKLSRFSAFFSSLSKWAIGLIFTLFSAFLAVQGITAGTRDGVSLRTARYAVSHYVPIVGGYLSEGMNLLIAGGVLVKNALGLSAVLLLVATVLRPLISVVVLSLGLKLTAAVLEPLADKGYSDFVSHAAKSLSMLVAVLLSVGFMYLITLVLLISTGNNLFLA